MPRVGAIHPLDLMMTSSEAALEVAASEVAWFSL